MARITLRRLVNMAKMRWRVERDYRGLSPRKLALDTTRGADGRASIITVRYASQSMNS